MYKTIAFLALASVVSSRDVIVGREVGNKIFDQNRTASPAIWRQADNITISTNHSEIITRVVITDQRPEKDGDARIVEGGEGHMNITVELKSPTVFRGYDFHIEIYAAENQGEQSGKTNNETATDRNTNINNNWSTPEVKNDEPLDPVEIGLAKEPKVAHTNGQGRLNRDTTGQVLSSTSTHKADDGISSTTASGIITTVSDKITERDNQEEKIDVTTEIVNIRHGSQPTVETAEDGSGIREPKLTAFGINSSTLKNEANKIESITNAPANKNVPINIPHNFGQSHSVDHKFVPTFGQTTEREKDLMNDEVTFQHNTQNGEAVSSTTEGKLVPIPYNIRHD